MTIKTPEGPVFKLAEPPKQASAEILLFPKAKIVRMAPDPVQEAHSEKTKIRNANNIVAELCNDLVNDMSEIYDIDIAENAFQKDFSYAIEVLRAAVYRTMDIPHPFHEYIDNYVQVATKDEMLAMQDAEVTAEIEPEASA